MKVGVYAIKYAELVHEQLSCQYGAGLAGGGVCSPFFTHLFQRKKKNKTLKCALWIILFSSYIWIAKSCLNEQISRFPFRQLPVGTFPVTFWLWSLLLFSSYEIFCPDPFSEPCCHATSNQPTDGTSWCLVRCLYCFTSWCSCIVKERERNLNAQFLTW